MKFVLLDSGHNIFHYLIVALINLVLFVISSVFSIYLTTIGFIVSEKVIDPCFPEYCQRLAIFSLFPQIPYFSLIKGFVLKYIDWGLQEAAGWWATAVGMPLVLIGISIFLISSFDLLFSIFSPFYNHTHCPLCPEALRIKLKNNKNNRNSLKTLS